VSGLFDRIHGFLDREYPNLGVKRMKFLSKLATYFAQGLRILGVFEPLIQTELPQSAGVVKTVSADLTDIGNVVVDVEQVGVALALKGPDKLKAAAPLVADIILKSSMLANHKVANPDLFNQGCTEIASGMADVINSLHPDGIQVISKQA
jgi:hypothetical protein